MFCQGTLQSVTQEIIKWWSVLSLPPLVFTYTPTWNLSYIWPCAKWEALQCSHKKNNLKPLWMYICSFSPLSSLCMSHKGTESPAMPWRKDTSSSHYLPCRVMDAQILPCVIWSKLPGTVGRWMQDCIASKLLLSHALPGHCFLWPLYQASNVSHCTVIHLTAYLSNFLKISFMPSLYGS